MIDLNPVLGIFYIEALLIPILFALIVPILRHKKNNATQNSALTLIKKLKKNGGSRGDQLEQLTNNLTGIEPGQLNEFLEEIKVNEKNFYQYLLRMFFSKDAELLKKIDKKVQSLSEPYCKLLSHSASASSNNEVLNEELQHAQKEISRLKKENQAFSQQQEIALNTMDEISSEYAQLFTSQRTELELTNSSKKILELFRTSGQRINQIHKQDQVGE
jgi:vacuolar-type H+-ATPase subunit I/STV1